MGRNIVDGCLLAGVSSNLGGNTFSLTELVIGTRTDSKTATPSTSSKPAFLQISRKSGESESASEENKQFDPGGERGEPPHSKADVQVSFSFSGGTLDLGGLACFFCLCLLCIALIRGSFFCELKKI